MGHEGMRMLRCILHHSKQLHSSAGCALTQCGPVTEVQVQLACWWIDIMISLFWRVLTGRARERPAIAAFQNSATRIMYLDEGWRELKASYIEPIAAYIVDTANDEQLAVDACCSPKLFVTAYTLSYNMCTQRSSHNFSGQLFERYIGTLRAFIGAYDEVLLTNLASSWQRYGFFVTVVRKLFIYLDRYYLKHHALPILQVAALRVFRTAIDDAYGSREAADAAVCACSEIADDDKLKLIAAHSSTITLSADAITETELDIVVRTEWKLADLCLKQLRTTLTAEIASVPDTEHTANDSLCEQLGAVNGALAGRLTLNELREQWQTWDSTYVSSLWSAFDETEPSCATKDDEMIDDINNSIMCMMMIAL
jgi:hypothetical protein